MCGTGRLRILDPTTKSRGELRWDDGPAWQLHLQVLHNEAEAAWMLQGHLHRNGETLPASEPLLIVPGGYVVMQTRVSRLHDDGVADWLQLLRSGEPLKIPLDEADDFVDRQYIWGFHK